MAETEQLWQALIDALSRREAAALLIVVDSIGSSPGKRGAKMLVTANASFGTIGGGAIEFRLMKIARALLTEQDASPQCHHLVHHATATGQASGMLCGGEQTVVIYPCTPEDLGLFTSILENSRQRRACTLHLSSRGLEITASETATPFRHFGNGENWHYRETLTPKRLACIIGAGHVCQALIRILQILSFDIQVFDDRPTLENLPGYPAGPPIQHVNYHEIAEQVPEGPAVFVFIMTHSHHGDTLVLSQLLNKRFAYLGLLGSHRKIAELKARLAGQLTDDALQKLHAPMGLAINSHTPAEIAISIAAELIQELNSKEP